MTWYVFVLFLHVLAAALAFGTAMMAFPFIGTFAEKHPAHVNFALRLNYALGKRGVTPLAMATFVLGILLVVMGDWNILESEWLSISIILFLITVLDAQLVTLPTVRKLVELTDDTEASTSGGSEELRRLVRKLRVGGTFSAVILATIFLLMVWKPG